ncbi:MAG TPA: YeaH/YhbH family protein [Methylomirabilota bacterium]|nr:YeaH/YhbH family protein [Methylomirabilota bacterium]
MHIIDRRSDPGGKSLGNRQRFLRRARALVRQAVREASASRSIREVGEGGAVAIPANGVAEPVFRTGASGVREHVLPGNKDYVAGDRIARPEGGGGGGSGGSGDGEAEDAFSFVLSADEFLDLFLEDLELPNLAKRQLTEEVKERRKSAGFRTSGPPAALSVPRTLRRSLSRRIALGRPRPEDTEALRSRIAEMEEAGGDEEAVQAFRVELERRAGRTRIIPFIDPVDLRFRRTEPHPEPIARAVMFCLMDVSASMDQEMKDLAKRFFSLLYLFLKRRYRHVEIVFIRHTHEAKAVDEETFFHSRESGGTVISSALQEMAKIAAANYPAHQWNIYAAQASDGDNTPGDNSRAVSLLRDIILPMSQYYAYIEVGRGERVTVPQAHRTTLWNAYEQMQSPGLPMAMRRVNDRRDIYPVFRELFERKSSAPTGGGET